MGIAPEQACPGAIVVHNGAQGLNGPITNMTVAAKHDSIIACRLNPEPIGALKSKVKGASMAETILRQVDHQQGLEARRVLVRDLNKQDQQPLNLEYQWLQPLVCSTTPKMSEFTLRIAGSSGLGREEHAPRAAPCRREGKG